MSMKIYNNLPDYIQSIDNENEFNKILKNFLLVKCYYAINDFLNDSNKNK